MRGLAVRHPDVQVAFILLGGQQGHLDVIIAFILLGRQPRECLAVSVLGHVV